MKQVILILTTLMILFQSLGCSTKNFKTQGNGAGYGGGDNSLSYARKLYVRALLQFRDGTAQTDLGNAEACRNHVRSQIVCNLLEGLAPTQKTYLVDFLKAHVQEFLDMSTGPGKVLFEFTNKPLTLSSTSGETRDLTAMTRLGRFGNIVFSNGAVNVMNDWEKLQLLTHELGHKLENIEPSMRYLEDDPPIGPFSSGKLFLDTLGAAFASYLASSVGKTIVSFPAQPFCDTNTTELVLASAPYYANKSQEAVGLKEPLSQVSGSGLDFTIGAWIRVFDDLATSDNLFKGQVLFSNKHFEDRYSYGLQLLRLNNGNFGAYGGTERIIDSGIKLTPGGFHWVTLKRTQKKFFLSIDGIPGNSDTAEVFSSFEAKNILSGLLDFNINAKQMLGAPGNNPTPRSNGSIANNGQDFHGFDFWKGNIAAFSFYNRALTDSEIGSLYQCAPNAYRVQTPNNVGPGYPIPTPETDGRIRAMLTHNKILYLAGDFEHYGDKMRYHLAALDTEKNNALTNWAPVVHGLSVNTMAVSGNTLFIGGNFLRVNGVERNNLAAIDLTTGNLIGAWNPNPDSEVLTLAISNNYLFVGGKFSKMGGAGTQKYIASLDISNINDIKLRNWNVVPDDFINTIHVAGNLLYLGGNFYDINGIDRRRLAAVDIESGALSSWAPRAKGGEVLTLSKIGNIVYVGGEFYALESSGVSQDRSYLGAIDDSDQATIQSFNPSPNNTVYNLVPSTNTIYVGGSFSEIAGANRNRVAELNLDGTLTNWNPSPDGTVFSVSPENTRVFLGGDFKNLNGQKALYFGLVNKQ